MDKNLVTNLQNEGKVSNLDKLLLNCLVNDYVRSLLNDITTKNIKIIDNKKYNLIYDEVYGAEVRLKVSNKLRRVINCSIKHETVKILGFEKDIFQIIY